MLWLERQLSLISIGVGHGWISISYIEVLVNIDAWLLKVILGWVAKRIFEQINLSYKIVIWANQLPPCRSIVINMIFMSRRVSNYMVLMIKCVYEMSREPKCIVHVLIYLEYVTFIKVIVSGQSGNQCMIINLCQIQAVRWMARGINNNHMRKKAIVCVKFEQD